MTPTDLPITRERESLSPPPTPESERWDNFRATDIPHARVFVSTVLRPSSALGYFGRYYETIAFPHDPAKGILWQSAASHEREANRQHDLAVRWFSRVHRPRTTLRSGVIPTDDRSVSSGSKLWQP